MTRGVQVDLNLPVFQDDLFALEANDLAGHRDFAHDTHDTQTTLI
ncbi:MAG: hypothetical protein QG599_1476 [Pseudomonadota bacterium]|nr:hypothetical protein [Pseudomonadota bacterium]